MRPGRLLADISETAATYPRRIFLLIAVAMLLGDAMTGKGTNVTVFMEYLLRGVLEGFGYVPLCIVVVLLAIIFTNFCNSVVLGLVLTPVLLAMCNAFGMNAGPHMTCFFYAVLIAPCPRDIPFAAMFFVPSGFPRRSGHVRRPRLPSSSRTSSSSASRSP